MFGISTAWVSGKISDGNELLRNLAETGLSAIEMDYRVTQAMLEAMRPLLVHEEFKVLSVHNYCPLPEGYTKEQATSLFQPASLDEDERRLAIKHSIISLQVAADLGAQVVVFHLGQVDMDPEESTLVKYFQQGEVFSEEANAFRKTKLLERSHKASPHLQALLHTLDRINNEAVKLGIYIGVENRYHYHQIPFADEFDLLFSEFHGGSLRYWHDCGHAELNHRLGFLNHETDLLARYQELLVGFHIHDINGLKDHKAPGQGNMDFSLIAKFQKSHMLKILEVHQPATAEQIRDGVRLLQQAGMDAQ
jgi:sugar phosphate isomerase/epimerase